MEKKIKKIMANVFGLNKKTINEESSSENIDNWDSLKHMNLIVALENEFDLEFAEEDIMEMMDFTTIVSIVNKHLS